MRHRRRLRLVLTAGVLALVAAVLVRALLGGYRISLPDAVRIVLGAEIPTATFILMESTLPRALLAAAAGAAFGLAGALFQAVLRNPLASPDIIGVGMGASAAAVVGIVVLGWSGAYLSIAAVLGALAVAVAIRLLAGPRPTHVVLVGVGTSAVLASVIHYLFTRADVWDAQLVLRWLTGSVSGASWPVIATVAAAVALVGVALAVLTRDLDLVELGPDLAAGLGSARRDDALLALSVVLMAVGVAGAGPVPFVAFTAAPIARALLRGRRSLVVAALVGAVVTVLADHLGSYLIPGVSLPLGVVTGLAGAPVLIWFLVTGRTVRSAP
jgi:iron complex transport system permease protein